MIRHTVVQKTFSFFIFLIVLSWPPPLSHAHDIHFEEVFDTGAYNMGIFQDRLGFLWLTTSNGLIRYDGYEQKVFKEGPDGLTSNLVPCAYEDSAGLLWIVTLSGVDLYDRKTDSFRHFRHDPANPASIGSNSFNWAPKLVTEDKNGLVWIGTKEGLYRYDRQTDKFSAFKFIADNDPNGLSADDIWTVTADREGTVWVGTSAGLDRYNPATNTFTHHTFNNRNGEDSHSPGKGIVYAVTEDRSGEIWVGTSEGGLSRFSKKDATFTHYRHDPDDPNSLACDEVFSITEDSENNLWIGRSFSRAVGLEKFNRNSGLFTLYQHDPADPDSLCGNIVLTCFADRSGILWIPENTGKIQKIDPYSRRFTLHGVDQDHPPTQGLHGLTSVYEDGRGDIWTGGQQGLSRYNRQSDTWTYFRSDPENPLALWNQYAFSILEDSDGNFWVATDDGTLNLFDRDKGIVRKRYQNPLVAKTARMIIEDRVDPNIFWFGIENYGLFKFNKINGEFTGYESRSDTLEGLCDGFIVSLLQNSDGDIWIQSHGGLYQFTPSTEKFVHYSHDPRDLFSVSSNVINDLHIDSQGIFWVSTDRGLNKFDPLNRRFLRYGSLHGFPTMSIRTILDDDAGRLWLGSDAGLLVFDPKQEKVTQTYTKDDGLQDNSFSLYGTSALKTRDGQMWFAGLNGANSFYPEKILANPYKPPVYLTSLTQGGENILPNPTMSWEKQINLDWRHNFFEFSYSALNFSQPQNNQYKYILEGWDNNWFHSGNQRFGRYSGLTGGDYTLKILAANNDGLWGQSPFKIHIHVDEAFWRTWWFYALCATSLLSGIFLLFFTRTKQLQKFNSELEAAYKQVQQAEEKYRSIFENATEGIFQSTPEGKLLNANKQCAVIMGYESSEQLLTEIDDIPHQVYAAPPDRKELQHLLKETGVVSNFETRFRRRDRSIIWVNISIRISHNEQNNQVLFDGIVKDITHRKEVEQELEKHRKNLESLVEERTRKVYEANIQLKHEIEERHRVEEELLRSRKLESLGVLAGGIAHDFNNLLSIIVGRISLAQLKLSPDDEANRDLDEAMRASEKATELSNKFITFSSGGKPIKNLNTIKEIIQSAVALKLSGSKVTPLYFLPDDLWPVFIDRDQIYQAFFNIVENAKESMTTGGTLQIRGKNIVVDQDQGDSGLPLSPGNYVMVSFQDQGHGIPEEYLSRIFDPYFTTNSMGTEKGKGLGLSITYSIIKNHKGYIFVDSEREAGTSVYIYIPAPS